MSVRLSVSHGMKSALQPARRRIDGCFLGVAAAKCGGDAEWESDQDEGGMMPNDIRMFKDIQMLAMAGKDRLHLREVRP